MKKPVKSFLLFCFTLAVLHFSSCKHDDYVAPATGISVSTDATLGPLLADSKGSTLYMFADDVTGQSMCTGGCLSVWPIAYIKNPTLGSGVTSADFGEITRADGSLQTTYKGFPLYYYSPDGNGKIEAAGETNGDGVENEWYVAKPSYTVMIATQVLVGHDGKNYNIDGSAGDVEARYFVDGNGNTLYAFSNDTKNNNNFTKDDLSNNSVWPVYDAPIADLPSGVNSADFGEITVGTQKQLTYKGWPLYYFGGNSTTAGDTRGQTRGVSFPSPNIWHVVNTETTPAPASVTVTQNGTLGKIITDSKGRSVYMFTKDTDKVSHCTGGCANLWPHFYTDVLTLGDASLSASDFDVVTALDGSKQTTYKGWLLYYFAPAGDGVIEPAGSTGGDGFGGGSWFVAKPSYTVMVANGQLVGGDGKSYTSTYVEGGGNTFYFVDTNGRTVYHFSHDANNTNTFTKADDMDHNNIWPIFHADLKDLPSTLHKEDFGEITVFGNKQTTYKGWPLYHFGGDALRNDTKGVSYPTPGGIWPVVYTSTDVAPN